LLFVEIENDDTIETKTEPATLAGEEQTEEEGEEEEQRGEVNSEELKLGEPVGFHLTVRKTYGGMETFSDNGWVGGV